MSEKPVGGGYLLPPEYHEQILSGNPIIGKILLPFFYDLDPAIKEFTFDWFGCKFHFIRNDQDVWILEE